MKANFRIAIAGSVTSTRRTLDGLLRNNATVVGVLGLAADKASNVSGYCRLDSVAAAASVPYHDFGNINDANVEQLLRAWRPDVLFVAGLSQLVRQPILVIPRLGCIGFHPTRLPEFRGRAPIAWLTLTGTGGAATFFLIDSGIDSGPIFVQEPFEVSPTDYAADVLTKAEAAIDGALDRWIPRLLSGEWSPQPQREELASYLGRRAPEDGVIDWRRSADEIYALIRASSRPHPGAYTFFRGSKITMWRADRQRTRRFLGVPGRVLELDNSCALVQTGTEPLWLTEMECNFPGAVSSLRVGVRFGDWPQSSLFSLSNAVEELRNRVAELEALQPDLGSGI